MNADDLIEKDEDFPEEYNPGLDLLRAAEELAAEFGNDVSEWTV